MATQLQRPVREQTLTIPSQLGQGFYRLYTLPHRIQLHHYRYCLQQQVKVKGINPVEEGMYIVNTNLSQKLLDKQVGDTQYWLSKEGGAGVLYYAPGNHSEGQNEIGLPYEVLFFSIPKAVLQQFLDSIGVEQAARDTVFCHYAELESALLEKGEGTVAEIGYRLGYQNSSQFSTQFKKHHGVSPSKLRP